MDGVDSHPLEIEAEEVVRLLCDVNWQDFHRAGSVVVEEAEEETFQLDLQIKYSVVRIQVED